MNNAEQLKDTVVIYHADCKDGFGAAYAAWKEFGDTASYIPRRTQLPPPEGLVGKEVYIVDLSYDQATLQDLLAKNQSLVVIDHHRSAEADVKAFPQNVFDLEHSGAILAWQYFHPDKPVPELLKYVEDHDLWRFALPDNMAFNAALRQYPHDFAAWDKLINDLQDTEFYQQFLAKGQLIVDFEDSLIDRILRFKHQVVLQDMTLSAVNASRIYRSVLGNKLAILNEKAGLPAIGIVYYYYDGRVHISLRSKGEYDVSKIAEFYGGGGHKNAASFSVPDFSDLPFTFIS